MLYKVEFYVCQNGSYPTLKTALIYAESVSECRTKAVKMLTEFKQDDVQISIEEDAA